MYLLSRDFLRSKSHFINKDFRSFDLGDPKGLARTLRHYENTVVKPGHTRRVGKAVYQNLFRLVLSLSTLSCTVQLYDQKYSSPNAGYIPLPYQINLSPRSFLSRISSLPVGNFTILNSSAKGTPVCLPPKARFIS